MRKELDQKFSPLAIDILAVRKYFEKFRALVNDENLFWDSIEAMSETIWHEFETSEYDPMS